MTTTNPTLAEQIRHHIATAQAEGRARPGRPTLVRLTGATDHQVRQILTTLAPPPPATNSTVQPNEPEAAVPVPGQNETLEPQPPSDSVRQTVGPPRTWPLALIALGAAVAVWSGWVGLGELTGFGDVRLLPGLWNNLHINTAVVLPLSVEAYGGYALRCWLATASESARTRTFARRSAITSLTIGAGAQVAYHLLTAAGVQRAPWPVTVLVACIPVLVLGLASALTWMTRNDSLERDSR